MQSGMALWPGSTTRAGRADDVAGSALTTMVRSGATCASAFATERKLPIP